MMVQELVMALVTVQKLVMALEQELVMALAMVREGGNPRFTY